MTTRRNGATGRIEEVICRCGAGLMGEDGPAALDACDDCGLEICDRCGDNGRCTEEFGNGCAERHDEIMAEEAEIEEAYAL